MPWYGYALVIGIPSLLVLGVVLYFVLRKKPAVPPKDSWDAGHDAVGKVVKAGDAEEIAEASSAMIGGRIAGLELARLEYTNLAYVRTILFEDGKHQVRTKFSQKHGMSMQLCTRRLGINFACRDIEEEFRP